MASHKLSRRKFLGQASCAAIGSTTLLSSLVNLKAIAASSIFNSSVLDCGGYKALVCLFQSGGNDSFNMLMPRTGSEYNTYAASRSNLAIAQNDILPIYPLNTPGREFGVHPSMPRVQNLFNSGKAAFISNTGTLVAPIANKQQFWDGTVATPLGLYSHADQAMHWQTGFPHARTSTGWAGKISDLLQSSNGNQNISMNISLNGSNVLQTGVDTVEYALDPNNGAIEIYTDSNVDWLANGILKTSMDNMVDATYSDLFQKTYIDKIKISREGSAAIQNALANVPAFTVPFSDNPDFNLSKSLEMVAKMIASRNALSMSRQIFFVEIGGWDHHDELLDKQGQMLGVVDNALYEFNAAMEQLGMSECVTTFTISEFSRTLTSNGNGTDHAWGANILTTGGAVNGKKIYGEYPDLVLDGPMDVGGGVFIPTTSADQYFGELALWFGVPESSLFDLFPNLSNFYAQGSGNPIGFLNI